jgi:hypothetical protein
MRRLLAVALTCAAIFPAAAQNAAAEGQNSPDSCGIGSLVSFVTGIAGGIGRTGHDAGLGNIGNEALQPFHSAIKEECH